MLIRGLAHLLMFAAALFPRQAMATYDVADCELLRAAATVHASGQLVVGSMRQDLKYIEVLPGAAPDNSGSASHENIRLIASGPLLGSMDSHKFETQLTCTNDGLTLTVNLLRSANYDGTAPLKNVPWRPRVEIRIPLLASAMPFRVTWLMHLTDGSTVDHTPSAFGKSIDTYPLVVKSIVQDSP